MPEDETWDGSRSKMTDLGRYRVERTLATDRESALYLAHDQTLDRLVVVRVPSSEGSLSAELAAYFERAKIAASIRHANLCPIYDVERVNGLDCVCMAHVEGRPLRDVIDRGDLSATVAAVIVRKIALAMNEAHRAGLMHGSLNPTQIYLNRRDEPIVMEYWYGAHLDAATDPRYVAPESDSQDGTADPRADVYSLGVIAYELFTGQHPSEGGSAKASESDAAVPSSRSPSLGRIVDEICLRAMAENPRDRYPSMKEFAQDLRKFLARKAKRGSSESHGSTNSQQGSQLDQDVGVDSAASISVAEKPSASRRSRGAGRRTGTGTSAGKTSSRVLIIGGAMVGVAVLAVALASFGVFRSKDVAQADDRGEANESSVDDSQPTPATEDPDLLPTTNSKPRSLLAPTPNSEMTFDQRMEPSELPTDDRQPQNRDTDAPTVAASPSANSETQASIDQVSPATFTEDPDTPIEVDGLANDWDFTLGRDDPQGDANHGLAFYDLMDSVAYHSADSIYVALRTANAPTKQPATYWIEVDLNEDGRAEAQLGTTGGKTFHFWARDDESEFTYRSIENAQVKIDEIIEFRIPWNLLREQLNDEDRQLIPSGNRSLPVRVRCFSVDPSSDDRPDTIPYFFSRGLPLTPFRRAARPLQWESVWIEDASTGWEIDANLERSELESLLKSRPRKGLHPYCLEGYISNDGQARYAAMWLDGPRTKALHDISLSELDSALADAEKERMQPISISSWTNKPLLNLILKKSAARPKLSAVFSDGRTIHADIDRARGLDLMLCGVTGWVDDGPRYLCLYSNAGWQGVSWRIDSAEYYVDQKRQRKLNRIVYVDSFRSNQKLCYITIQDSREKEYPLPKRRIESTTSLARFNQLIAEMKAGGFRPISVAVAR